MGYGDYCHWTAVIRDLYQEINNKKNNNEKVILIEKLINFKKKNESKYGIIDFKNKNSNSEFKFLLKKGKNMIINFTKQHEVFINNPYVTNDQNYSNIIILEIESCGYGKNGKFDDKQHVVDLYAKNIGMKEFNIKFNLEADIHFTDEEIKKVKNNLPKDDFILIQPESHKKGKSYPLEKMQSIVNKLKDRISFIQISPSKFAKKKSCFLENIKIFKDIFTYRETIYFASFAKLCLLPEGGLAMGISSQKTKTIVIYSNKFNCKMTKYSNQIAINVCDSSHDYCYNYNTICSECEKFFKIHNENIIVDLIENLLNLKIKNEIALVYVGESIFKEYVIKNHQNLLNKMKKNNIIYKVYNFENIEKKDFTDKFYHIYEKIKEEVIFYIKPDIYISEKIISNIIEHIKNIFNKKSNLYFYGRGKYSNDYELNKKVSFNVFNFSCKEFTENDNKVYNWLILFDKKIIVGRKKFLEIMEKKSDISKNENKKIVYLIKNNKLCYWVDCNMYQIKNKPNSFTLEETIYNFHKSSFEKKGKNKLKKLQLKIMNVYRKKKIVIYQDRNIDNPIINNVLNSAKLFFSNNNNYDFSFIENKNFKLEKADYAIIWNVYCKFKKNTLYRNMVKNFQKKNNDKLIIFELGFINRDKYYSIGYNHISNFGNYPIFPDNNNRLKNFNLNLKELNYDNNKDKHILFCSQVPWDTQVQDINYNNWILNTLKKIKDCTKRKIIFRKHPKHTKNKKFKLYSKKFFNNNNLTVEISKNDLNTDLKNCYCVVAYNSTILLDAIIKGVPIIAGSTTSIVSDIAVKDIELIEKLPKFTKKDIIKCLSKICYKQWNVEEIKKGEPFKYFI